MEEAGRVARGERRGDGLLVELFWGMHGLDSPGRRGRATMVGEYISLLLEVGFCCCCCCWFMILARWDDREQRRQQNSQPLVMIQSKLDEDLLYIRATKRN